MNLGYNFLFLRASQHIEKGPYVVYDTPLYGKLREIQFYSWNAFGVRKTDRLLVEIS